MSSKDKKIQKDGLTTQEYSFKHAIPIETILASDDKSEKVSQNKLSNNQVNKEQQNILKAYHDLKLLINVDNNIHIYEEVRKLDYLYWIENKLSSLGFKFYEENKYSDESHKTITRNFIATSKKNINFIDIQNYEISDFYLYLSIILLCKGYISNGYIYLKDIKNDVLKFSKKILINIIYKSIN